MCQNLRRRCFSGRKTKLLLYEILRPGDRRVHKLSVDYVNATAQSEKRKFSFLLYLCFLKYCNSGACHNHKTLHWHFPCSFHAFYMAATRCKSLLLTSYGQHRSLNADTKLMFLSRYLCKNFVTSPNKELNNITFIFQLIKDISYYNNRNHFQTIHLP